MKWQEIVNSLQLSTIPFNIGCECYFLINMDATFILILLLVIFFIAAAILLFLWYYHFGNFVMLYRSSASEESLQDPFTYIPPQTQRTQVYIKILGQGMIEKKTETHFYLLNEEKQGQNSFKTFMINLESNFRQQYLSSFLVHESQLA